MTFEEMKALPREEQERLYKRLKSVRSVYKAGNYASVYGVGKETLSRALKSTTTLASKVIDAYWKRNWSVRAVAESLEATSVQTVDGQMWLLNPVSQFWYSLRNKKDIFSTLNQGTGVYCFDTWIRYILKERPQLTGQFHDEIILTIKKGSREKCKALLERALSKANKHLKLNRELGISIDFGDTYAEIH